MEDQSKTRLVWALALSIFAAEAMLFVRWIPDDAFISFRYAANLSAGNGMVFNPGERVEGMSNPLWTALLGAATRAGLDTVWTAVTLSLACSLASIIFTFKLFEAVLDPGGAVSPHGMDHEVERRRFLGLRTVLAAGLVTSLPMIFYATSGLETHAEGVLLLAGTVLHLEAHRRGDAGRMIGSQAALLCVSLLRPEGILFLLLGSAFILSDSTVRKGAAARGAALVPLFVFAAIYTWKASYYGALIPNTYLAKPGASIGYLQPIWRGTFYLVRYFLVSGLVLLLPFCAIAFSTIRRRYACTFIAALIAAQLAFIVFVGGDVLRFDRFTVPFIPLLLALALAGFVRLDALSRVRSRRLSMAAAVFCVTLMVGLNAGRVAIAIQKTCIHDWMHARVHRTLGEFLGEALPGGSVVVNEVGAIAYKSGLVTWDMIGLTDSEVGRILYESYHRYGDSGTPWSVPRIADYLLSRNASCIIVPSYGPVTAGAPVVGLMHPIWEGVFTHRDLALRYRCWFRTRIHDDKYWNVFIRNDITDPGVDPSSLANTGTPCMAIEECSPGAAGHGN
jgi:arabinofuranosyltransferase